MVIPGGVDLRRRQFLANPRRPRCTEIRGKQVYVKGESGERAITAMLGTADLEVPASSFSCSNCHRRRGEGTREGGLQPTPIDWETLTRPLNTPYPPQHP